MISSHCSIFIAVISCVMHSTLAIYNIRRGGKFAVQFQFPFLCVIHYKWELGGKGVGYTPVSVGSIYSSKYVMASADNFDRPASPPVEGNRRYYQMVDRLYAYAGVAQLHVDGTEQFAKDYGSTVQIRRVENLVFSRSAQQFQGIVTRGKNIPEFINYNPSDFNDTQFKNNGKFAWGLAIAELVEPWKWTPNVRPMPFYDDYYVNTYANEMHVAKDMDIDPYMYSSCAIASFGLGTVAGLTYRQVAYVPRNRCKAAYCSDDLDNCLNYPFFEYEVCFKSLDFVDVCAMDQGSALICKWFDNSTYAILTGTKNCGMYGLPGVYTLITAVSNFFTFAMREPIEPRPLDKETMEKWEATKPPYPS